MAAQCPSKKHKDTQWVVKGGLCKVSYADLSTVAQLSSEVCWETVTQGARGTSYNFVAGRLKWEIGVVFSGETYSPEKKDLQIPNL